MAQDGTGRELEEVREKRRRLRDAMADLEEALSSAAGPAEWPLDVTTTLEAFQAALERHVTLTERDGGLHGQILDHAPRLSRKVDRLSREHRELTEATAELLERSRDGDLDQAAIDELRQDALDLLGLVVRHRQLGADLLYEAYEVDIAAGD